VRLLGIAPSLVLALLVAQTRSSSRPARDRADAGDRPILLGTDPPGRLRPSPATDGGTANPAPPDAGPDEVHRDLQLLRARLETLEQERAQHQRTAQQLQQLTQEVQLLRQQIADAEAQRLAAEQQREANRAAVQSAVEVLYSAQEQLAGGNSAIEGALDRAQATFTGQAQRDVVAARAALRNRDLSAARALLSAAISDAQSGR
jgi:uncharacterized membrane-anchored protein YhcB (DUF1043 family)